MRVFRALVGGLGEVLVTMGVLLLLFVVWQLGFVAIVEGNRQAGVVSALEKDFASSLPGGTRPSAPTAPGPSPGGPTPGAGLADGQVFAILRIPRLGGPTWAKPVLQGTSLDVLARGLGHYPQTQLPGEIGNVAIAGHRAGHGNPLIDIDAIQQGDVMVIETREAYFVYRAWGHEIVAPSDVAVLAPAPKQPGATATQPWFTLTSCNPRYGSTHRYIVFASLERKIARSEGLPADLLADPAATA